MERPTPRFSLLVAADSVADSTSFATFVEASRQDLLDHEDGWENPTLERFLDAMAGWVTDMDGWRENAGNTDPLPDANAWRWIARILLAAQVYE